MGACASRPKEFDKKQEPLPEVDSTIPEKAEGENVPQVENGGEAKKDEALVDAQEAPKTEEAESKPAAEVEAVSEEAKPTEDKVEAVEEVKKEVQGGEQKPNVEEAIASPRSGDKSDAPLVTL